MKILASRSRIHYLFRAGTDRFHSIWFVGFLSWLLLIELEVIMLFFRLSLQVEMGFEATNLVPFDELGMPEVTISPVSPSFSCPSTPVIFSLHFLSP